MSRGVLSELTARPLCPHCYRFACAWLGEWRARVLAAARGGQAFQPPNARVCHLQGQPLAPNTRKRLSERLGGVPDWPPSPDRFGPSRYPDCPHGCEAYHTDTENGCGVCWRADRLRAATEANPEHTPDRFGPRPKTREALVRAFLADIEACPAPPPPQWVPVSERLPTNASRVLVACVLADARPGVLPPTLDVGEYNQRYSTWYVNTRQPNTPGLRVTHWQPLPTPPGDAVETQE